MHSLATSTLAWVGFCSFILVMLAIDLGVFNRKPHEITYRMRRSGAVSGWRWRWFLPDCCLVRWAGSCLAPRVTRKALEFLTGYLIELSLSVDNLFVFLLIFSYFKVPPKYQHRVLYWGVLGALVMRVAMIWSGTELINRFHWIIYIFGAFLVYTGVQMLRGGETEIEPEDNPSSGLSRVMFRSLDITSAGNSSPMVDGKRVGTLLCWC